MTQPVTTPIKPPGYETFDAGPSASVDEGDGDPTSEVSATAPVVLETGRQFLSPTLERSTVGYRDLM